MLPPIIRQTLQKPYKTACPDGIAMHMDWLGGMGRETGIGKNRDWHELNEFRARTR